MTTQTATHEAQKYVAKLVSAQGQLGYRRPDQSVVKAAVDEAAQAVKTLAALSTRKP
jgi:hypothetical protein